jgi:hypothetical protein
MAAQEFADLGCAGAMQSSIQILNLISSELTDSRKSTPKLTRKGLSTFEIAAAIQQLCAA